MMIGYYEIEHFIDNNQCIQLILLNHCVMRHPYLITIGSIFNFYITISNYLAIAFEMCTVCLYSIMEEGNILQFETKQNCIHQ